tara:strand:+ start:659 stop:1105 length:447 start_codon:yes stop_codon:yes gene_type:complete
MEEAGKPPKFFNLMEELLLAIRHALVACTSSLVWFPTPLAPDKSHRSESILPSEFIGGLTRIFEVSWAKAPMPNLEIFVGPVNSTTELLSARTPGLLQEFASLESDHEDAMSSPAILPKVKFVQAPLVAAEPTPLKEILELSWTKVPG